MGFIQRFLDSHLTDDVKRLVCLVTLGYKVQEGLNGQPDRSFLSRLNAALNLAEEEGALKFSVCWANVLWRHLKIPHQHDINELVELVYHQIPSYLLYGDKQKVQDDIRFLFYQCEGV